MGAVKIYWMLVTLATPPFTFSSSMDLEVSSSLDLEPSSSLDMEASSHLGLEAGPTSVGSPSFWDEDDDSTGVQLEVRNLEEFEYFQHMELLDTYGLSSLNFSDFEDLSDTYNLSNLSEFESFDQALLIDLVGDEEEFEELDQELDYLLDELGVEEDLIDEALGEEEEEENEEKSKDGEEDENEGSMLSKSLLLLQTKNLAAGEDVESQLVEDSKDSRRGKIYSGLKWGSLALSVVLLAAAMLATYSYANHRNKCEGLKKPDTTTVAPV